MSTNGEAESTDVRTDFADRRGRLHLTQEEIAAEAGMNRDTVGAIEAGHGSAAKRRHLHEALTRLEDEAGLSALPLKPVAGGPHPGFVRIEVPNVYGARALILEGPVDDPDALAAMVDAIMRRIQAAGD